MKNKIILSAVLASALFASDKVAEEEKTDNGKLTQTK